MHKMLHEKHERQKQIKEDQARKIKIDETIGNHITPQLVCMPPCLWHSSMHAPACPGHLRAWPAGLRQAT